MNMNPLPPKLTIDEVCTINRRIKLQSSRQLRLINRQREIIQSKDAYIVELERLLDQKIIETLNQKTFNPKPPSNPRKSKNTAPHRRKNN